MAATRLVIDCDPGIDDAIALLLAVASPELSLEAVTAVGGNNGLDRTAPNALRMLELGGSRRHPRQRRCRAAAGVAA